MSRRPLIQPPALHDPPRLLERLVLPTNISTKDLKLAAHLGALKQLRLRTRERRDARGVRESGVQLCGRGAELLAGGHGGGVDVGGLVGGGGWGGSGSGFGGLEVGGRAPSGGGVVGGRVLDVLSVLADEGGAQLGEDGAQLGDEGGADEVLYGLLGGGFGEDVDVELGGEGVNGVDYWVGLGGREGGHTTYSSSSVSWATSGMVMLPLTVSSSAVFPSRDKSDQSNSFVQLWYIAN